MNNDGYEIEDCERMIERCESNIATLEYGIDRERESIKHFTKVIEALKAKAEAEPNVVSIGHRN